MHQFKRHPNRAKSTIAQFPCRNSMSDHGEPTGITPEPGKKSIAPCLACGAQTTVNQPVRPGRYTETGGQVTASRYNYPGHTTFTVPNDHVTPGFPVWKQLAEDSRRSDKKVVPNIPAAYPSSAWGPMQNTGAALPLTGTLTYFQSEEWCEHFLPVREVRQLIEGLKVDMETWTGRVKDAFQKIRHRNFRFDLLSPYPVPDVMDVVPDRKRPIIQGSLTTKPVSVVPTIRGLESLRPVPYEAAPYDWRIMVNCVETHKAGKPLAGVRLLVIQHVLSDLIHLITAFISLGCEPADITVIGIPYSSRKEAGDAIGALGCRVELPSRFPFDAKVTQILLAMLAVPDGKPMVIVEDGGYATPQLSQLADNIDIHRILGTVEQTRRGTRIASKLEEDGDLRVPVISIPDCFVKRTFEPPHIARAFVRNLKDRMEQINGDSALEQFRTVGVFGYGVIGKSLANHLKSMGKTVYVVDSSIEPRLEARLEEFKELTLDRIPQCDLIVGTSGTTSIDRLMLDAMKQDTVIASLSSRQVEIDLDCLHANSSGRPELLGEIGPAVLPIYAGYRYHYSATGSGAFLTVLYAGYPLNFSGNSLPDHIADPILALMLEGTIRMAIEGLRLVRHEVYNGQTILHDVETRIVELFQQAATSLNDTTNLKETIHG